MLEAPDAVTAVFAGVLDLFVGAVDFTVLLQPQRQRPVHDLHVAQQDQRARSRRAQRSHGDGVFLTEPQQFVEIGPAIRVLDDVDDGAVEPYLHEHYAARREVDRVVAQLGAGQPGDERRIGIEQAHIGEHDAGEQRPADLAHFDRAVYRAFDHGAGHAREHRAARSRADERVERAEETGEQSDQRPERDTQVAAHLERLSHGELDHDFLPERLGGSQGRVRGADLRDRAGRIARLVQQRAALGRITVVGGVDAHRPEGRVEADTDAGRHAHAAERDDFLAALPDLPGIDEYAEAHPRSPDRRRQP